MSTLPREILNVAILVTSQTLFIIVTVMALSGVDVASPAFRSRAISFVMAGGVVAAIGSLMTGQLLHRLGWEALNLAMLPPVMLVALATVWRRSRRWVVHQQVG